MNIYNQLDGLQRIIEANDGRYEFPALFNRRTGKQVPARVRESRSGRRYWQLLDDHGNPTGETLPYRPSKRSVLSKKGYKEGRVSLPAEAYIGLSGSRQEVRVRPLPTN